VKDYEKKYLNKEVIVNYCLCAMEKGVVVGGVFYGDYLMLLVESTDGWCYGHDGNGEKLLFGNKRGSNKCDCWYVSVEYVKFDDFIKI